MKQRAKSVEYADEEPLAPLNGAEAVSMAMIGLVTLLGIVFAS